MRFLFESGTIYPLIETPYSTRSGFDDDDDDDAVATDTLVI